MGYLSAVDSVKKVSMNLLFFGCGVFVGLISYIWGFKYFSFSVLLVTSLFVLLKAFRSFVADQFMGLSSGLRQSYSGIRGDLVSGEAILLEIQNTYLREDEKPVVWMKLKMQNPAGPVIEIYRPVSWKNFQDFQAGKLIKVTFDSGDIPGTLSVIAAPDSRDANLDMI